MYARINFKASKRIRIIERLKTDKPIAVNYLNRLSNVIDIPEGSTFTWQPAMLKKKPKFILLGFKDPEVTYTKNNSQFIQWEADNKKN